MHVVFCTNNSAPTIDEYVGRLRSHGLEVDASDIVTSAVVTGEVLAGRGLAGSVAIVIGGPGVVECLERAGIEVDRDPRSRVADLVVVGHDIDFDFDAMRQATMAIAAGATLIATNSDASFPAPDGLWPGAGAILASIETASGTTAEVMGKPHPPMMEAVSRRLGDAHSVAIVGDRADTDLAGGRERGWTTVLVLSGVTAEDQVATIDPPPDLVLASIADLEAGERFEVE